MGIALERRDFEGTIVRRDQDGYGLVKLDKPDVDGLAFFTVEVLQNPAVASSCKVGRRVVGRAELKNGGYRILRLEPK